MPDTVIMSNKDMTHGMDTVPRELKACDTIIPLNQTDVSTWQVVNGLDYVCFIFWEPSG